MNIMGFTSELEELRSDIFKRIAALAAPRPGGRRQCRAGPRGDDQQLSQDFTEALGFIKSSIAKMDRLINAILNLTREGRREFEPVPIDTADLIEASSRRWRTRPRTPNAEIRIEPLPDIVSDRLALEQIFSNLIDNALKYLKPGVPGEIAVRGRTQARLCDFRGRRQRPRHRSQDHERIFDLFRRAGTQDKPGQGIGLAHVRALVRRLGGTMSVHSELHHGSTFTIALPTLGQSPSGTRRFMSKPVCIIMIEDDEGHARLIEKNIRRAGVNNEIVPFRERHRRADLSVRRRRHRRRRTRTSRC